MNLYAVRAIYSFEMARTWRTLMQSIFSPVLSTSLYFIVFGAGVYYIAKLVRAGPDATPPIGAGGDASRRPMEAAGNP